MLDNFPVFFFTYSEHFSPLEEYSSTVKNQQKGASVHCRVATVHQLGKKKYRWERREGMGERRKGRLEEREGLWERRLGL
jgi:hypothetical protein